MAQIGEAHNYAGLDYTYRRPRFLILLSDDAYCEVFERLASCGTANQLALPSVAQFHQECKKYGPQVKQLLLHVLYTGLTRRGGCHVLLRRTWRTSSFPPRSNNASRARRCALTSKTRAQKATSALLQMKTKRKLPQETVYRNSLVLYSRRNWGFFMTLSI